MIDPALDGKAALVTGANSNIGAGIARALAAQGAPVVIHYLAEQPRDPDPPYRSETAFEGEAGALRVVGEIRREGGRAAAVAEDLADPHAVPSLFDRAERAFGPLCVLVNNAAYCEVPDTTESVSAAGFDRHFAVNARAPLLLMAEFIRRFRAHKLAAGRVVNISTDWARAFAGQIAYGASKAALEAFTRSVAIEAGRFGITVNAIAAGPVQTGYITPELEARVLPGIPMGRIGTAEDIAAAVVFLSSAQAGWITGQVLQVAGGHAL